MDTTPTLPPSQALTSSWLEVTESAVMTVARGASSLVRGIGRLVSDPVVRAEAAESGYQPREEDILFELGIEEVLATEYDAGTPRYRRWSGAKS
ncbi:MAG: hypothetical protein ACRDTF_22310 [Pseudonocardiaceae bacterium]